ncbi:hypothetical protein CDAR_615131 [Caerostris darwini]|uniref:Uncharacterized protein n=1 Tax=Caerostris darwini TaxID=1538125 RepID=A0AAV4RBQ2_9ARAC|nr:hypothetical protein CDAR_615131 [Caerostris darwini]
MKLRIGRRNEVSVTPDECEVRDQKNKRDFAMNLPRKWKELFPEISTAKAAADAFRWSLISQICPEGHPLSRGLITPDDFGRRRRSKRENFLREMIGLAPLRFFRADSP